MSFVPTYQDYVNALGHEPDMTEAMWNALSDADKWGQTGGALQIRPGDPRYSDLASVAGGEPGRLMNVTQGSRQNFHGGLVGPEADLGNGIFAHNQSSQSPQLQAFGHRQFDPMILGLPLAFMGAGMLANGGLGSLFGGDLPAMEGPGAFDAGGSTGMGDVFGGANGAAPVTDLSTAAGGAPVTDLSTQAGLGDTLRNLVPGGLLGGSGMTSLLRAAGLGTSLYGLLGHNGSNGSNGSNGNSGSNSSKGGNGNSLNVTRGAYTPNPITQQQLQNFQYAQPRRIG